MSVCVCVHTVIFKLSFIITCITVINATASIPYQYCRHFMLLCILRRCEAREGRPQRPLAPTQARCNKLRPS